MTKLQLWDPVGDIWGLKNEIDRLFFGFGRRGKESDTALATWSPAVDVMEDKEAIRFQVELPGMKKGDVKVSVDNGILTIRGERTFKNEEKKKNYHRIESSYGLFERSFSLPNTVMTDKVSASMQDGILEIVVPKKEEARPKEIEIQVK